MPLHCGPEGCPMVRSPWLALTILAAAACQVLHWYPLRGYWWYGDDLAWLASAKNAPSLIHFLGKTPWDWYFRPTFHFLVWVQWTLFGLNPLPYRVVSLGLHWLAALLLGLLVRRARGPEEGVVVASVFACLGHGTEAVAWFSGQTILLATVGAEAALLVWMSTTRPLARVVWSSLLALLAFGASLAVVVVLVPMAWAAPRRVRPWLMILLVAALAVAGGQWMVGPHLAQRLQVSRRPLIMGWRSWVDMWASVLPGVPWEVSLVTLGLTGVVWPGSWVLHLLGWVVLLPHAWLSGRHDAPFILIPFDRYLYPARAVLASLLGIVAWRLLTLPSLPRACRWVMPGLLLALALASVPLVRRWDAVLGAPSRRLSRAVTELRAVLPRAPVVMVNDGLAVPECYFSRAVGTLFLDGRFICDVPSRGQVLVRRTRDGALALFPVP